MGENGLVIPCDNVTLEVKAMIPARRIAAAALVAAFSIGIIGVGAAPANADYTWGTRIGVSR